MLLIFKSPLLRPKVNDEWLHISVTVNRFHVWGHAAEMVSSNCDWVYSTSQSELTSFVQVKQVELTLTHDRLTNAHPVLEMSK